MDILVGTFAHQSLFIIHFAPPNAVSETATLRIVRDLPALGGHSWLALSDTKQYLYTTVWSADGQPAIASYRVKHSSRDIQFLNVKPVKNLSGYICSNKTHVFSAGGATGEVFQIEADGSLGALVQELDFVTDHGENQSEKRGAVAHGDFGGLRHGAHSADLSPDGRSLYVADIGRNCIWTYRVLHSQTGNLDPPLELHSKHISPRSHDGPRHAWPHPNGAVLYCLQEHSSMVDVFAIAADGVTLEHKQGVKIIPQEQDCNLFWADEVRCSATPPLGIPKYLYASTRGLDKETMGYVAVFKLKENGLLESEQPLDLWMTPTSGGLANAIEPAPCRTASEEIEYLALTDSQEGWVSVLSFDGKQIREACKLNLGKTGDGKTIGAATAVWL